MDVRATALRVGSRFRFRTQPTQVYEVRQLIPPVDGSTRTQPRTGSIVCFPRRTWIAAVTPFLVDMSRYRIYRVSP